jgi:hypothetical protein
MQAWTQKCGAEASLLRLYGSHRQTNKQVRMQQSSKPRHNRKRVIQQAVNGLNQC